MDNPSSETTMVPFLHLNEWLNSMTNVSDTSIPVTNADGKIVSDRIIFIFQAIFFVALCGCTSFMGIISNTINMVVFYRQGVMSDSSNVSLLALAIADFCCLITVFWLGICYIMVLTKPPGLPFDPYDVVYLTAGWPRMMFAQTTSAITTYIALERCMCVVFPFKVKSWFSAKKSLVVVCIIFTFYISFYTPVFAAHRLVIRTNPATNTSKVRLSFMGYRRSIQKVTHYVNNITLTTLAICTVAICTKITASKITSSKDFRQSLGTSGAKPGEPSATEQNDSQAQAKIVSKDAFRKETRLVRMITLICTVFLVCYFPGIFITYLASIEPEISNKGKYKNLFQCLFAISFFTETICSSMNIFIYYNMSSRYRQEFRKWFGLKDNDN